MIKLKTTSTRTLQLQHERLRFHAQLDLQRRPTYLSSSVGEEDAVLALGRLAVAVLHVAEGVAAVAVLDAPREVVRHSLHRLRTERELHQ